MIDTQILTSIQIACIGIIVVIGLFLIWRSLNKLHEKVERLSCECATMCSGASRTGGATGASESQQTTTADAKCSLSRQCAAKGDYDEYEDDDFEDDALMNAIFEGEDPINGQTTFMLFSPFGATTAAQPAAPAASQGARVEIEEVQDAEPESVQPAQPSPIQAPQAPPAPQSHVSGGASDDSKKYKLKKLNVEALKEQLEAKGLSTDGTKNQLIDRLLAASD